MPNHRFGPIRTHSDRTGALLWRSRLNLTGQPVAPLHQRLGFYEADVFALALIHKVTSSPSYASVISSP